MSVWIIIAVFILGVIIGAVGIMIFSCLMVEHMRQKRELTKEEWKMGIHPDYSGTGSGVAYIIGVILTLGLALFIIFGNR